MTLTETFGSTSFTPHGFCLLWNPLLIWLHVVADLCIVLAYFSIPAALMIMLRRRPAASFSWIGWLFAAFIMACGTTHLMNIITLWSADYWMEGVVKIITAGLSVATAIVLWPLIPTIMALPSPAALVRVNEMLSHRIQEQETAVADAVTARREAQTRLGHAEQMEALGQLAGGIAHDFNNVLQVVASAARSIDRRPGNADAVRNRASQLIEAAERGAAIVGRLLAFARRSDLRFEAIDVGALFKRLTEVLKHTLGPGVHVSYHVEDHLALLQVDRSRLETVLINLATNARDAMPEGGGKLTFAAEMASLDEATATTSGQYVRLSVIDNGFGMDADTLARATEPFFTTKPQGKGTGLGLSMARGFADQSGGRFSISSKLNHGTTVTLLLPKAPPLETVTSTIAQQNAAYYALTGAPPPKILFVDDEPIIRDLLTDELRELGMSVEQASGGDEAMNLMSPAIDILITDYSMADMNGLSLIRKIRQDHPRIRTIMLTGLVDIDSSASIDAANGVDLLLRKPVTGAELVRHTLRLLDSVEHSYAV